MIHFFLVDDGHGFFYKIGIEGEKQEIVTYLDGLNLRNCTYMTTKPEDQYGFGKRHLSEDIVVRSCKYHHMLNTRHE